MRFAIVTGGGTGIGAATAIALAEDGCEVLLVGRRERPLREAADLIGPAASIHLADLTSPADVDALAESLDRPVDVLVNNAGGFDVESGGASTAARADWWRRVYDANVLTAILLTEALRHAIARPDGRVVLLSSVAAQRGGAGPYSAAKAALHGYAYDLARDLGPDGITVNVVAPGYTAGTEFFGARITPESHARRVAETLVGRAGLPQDVAAAIRYLASTQAGYVTGQVLGVNGGTVFGR